MCLEMQPKMQHYISFWYTSVSKLGQMENIAAPLLLENGKYGKFVTCGAWDKLTQDDMAFFEI